MLSSRPVTTWDVTSEKRPRTMRRSTRVMPSTIPPACMQAPKHMAQRMSHMVLSMPAMPRVETRLLSKGSEVGTSVLPKQDVRAARKIEGSISRITSVWTRTAATTPIMVERKRVTMGGRRRAIIRAVSRGTMRRHGLMTKRLVRALAN